jgi:hypothetical protein
MFKMDAVVGNSDQACLSVAFWSREGGNDEYVGHLVL